MIKLLIILFLFTMGCEKKQSYALYGIEVQKSEYLTDEMKEKYQHASLPLPQTLQSLLSEIIIFNESEEAELSGYTQTKTINGEWISSVIYLSSHYFQVETLLHEALHIYDAKYHISTSSSFHYVMKEEMNQKWNHRIYQYYERKDYPSEYFVESMIHILSDSMNLKIHQPLTYHYLKEHAKAIKDEVQNEEETGIISLKK